MRKKNIDNKIQEEDPKQNKQFIVKCALISVILMVIDQLIKIFGSNNFMDQTIPIIDNYLYIEPCLNPNIMFYNVKYGWDIGIEIAILIPALVIIIMGVIGIKYAGIYRGQKLVVVGYIILFGGALASLMDCVFWGTSLDYIYIKNWYTFDLKDMYIEVGMWMWIAGYIYFQCKQVKEKIEYEKNKDINE